MSVFSQYSFIGLYCYLPFLFFQKYPFETIFTTRVLDLYKQFYTRIEQQFKHLEANQSVVSNY